MIRIATALRDLRGGDITKRREREENPQMGMPEMTVFSGSTISLQQPRVVP